MDHFRKILPMTAFRPTTRLTFGLNFGVFWFFIVFNFVRQIGLNRWRLVWFFIRRQWRFRKFQQFVQIRLQRLQINLQIRCHFFWENVHTSNVRDSPLFVVVYVFDIAYSDQKKCNWDLKLWQATLHQLSQGQWFQKSLALAALNR